VKRASHAWAWAAVAFVCAQAITGCAQSRAAARPAAAPTPTPTSVLQDRLPLAAYELTPVQLASEDYLMLWLEQVCMRRLGFDFLPGLSTASVGLGARITDEFETRWYGVSDPGAANRYGYHLPGWVQGTAAPDVVIKMPEAERGALIGMARTHAGRPIPAQGCTGQARRQLSQAGVSIQQPGSGGPAALVGALQLASFERAQADPRVRAVFAKWARCMRSYGDRYATPFAAAADRRWTSSAIASPAEIQTARHDISCKLRVNLLGVEFAVESGYQKAAIAAHTRALSQLKKDIERQAVALRRLLGQYAVPAQTIKLRPAGRP
jgi:hypothetical protein